MIGTYRRIIGPFYFFLVGDMKAISFRHHLLDCSVLYFDLRRRRHQVTRYRRNYVFVSENLPEPFRASFSSKAKMQQRYARRGQMKVLQDVSV